MERGGEEGDLNVIDKISFIIPNSFVGFFVSFLKIKKLMFFRIV